MTNEEAINTLNSIKQYYNDKNEDSYVGFDNEDNEALDMAIEALGTQSCDCVSRKDVIILIDEATELHPYKVIGDSETYSNYNQGWEDACNWLYANIESDNLKTVTPKANEGKWIEYCYQNLSCSNCGYIVADTDIDEYKYCPNCGAKMEVEDDT